MSNILLVDLMFEVASLTCDLLGLRPGENWPNLTTGIKAPDRNRIYVESGTKK